MNHKHVITGCALLFSLCGSSALAQPAPVATGAAKLDWNIEKTWDLPAKPLDLVYGLDGKHVFILTDQHTVLIYTSQGELKGSIPVDKGVSAIDIEPRGNRLYLIDQEKKTFSDLSVDFIANINIKGSPFRGLDTAPVVIAVFTDFE